MLRFYIFGSFIENAGVQLSKEDGQIGEEPGMHKSFFNVASCVFVRQKPPFGQFLPSNTILPMIEES